MVTGLLVVMALQGMPTSNYNVTPEAYRVYTNLTSIKKRENIIQPQQVLFSH